MASNNNCSTWQKIATVIAIIVFLILLGFAIDSLIKNKSNYDQNRLGTMAKKHENESVTLPDSALCVPLSFMINDQKLIEAAKYTLLHDQTFLSQSLKLDNPRAAKKYWDLKNPGNDTITPRELIESFINETLKPFLKNNISFPDETPLDKLMSQQEDVYDIIETSDKKLINKTILLASVALIDIMTGYGEGRASASNLFTLASFNNDEASIISAMAKSVLNKPSVADQFAANVARTLCEIYAPNWNGNKVAICGQDGLISKTPYYISLNEFCFNVPTSSTPFTKSNPTASLAVTLPLSQSIFAFGPLSTYINGSMGNFNLSQQIPTAQMALDQRPENPFGIAINISNAIGDQNRSLSFSNDQGDQWQKVMSALGVNLPIKFDARNLTDQLKIKNANFTFHVQPDEQPEKVQAKFQHQMQELMHSDLLSLAFKFPVVAPRQVTVYFPNDMRYYDWDDTSIINLGNVAVPIPSTLKIDSDNPNDNTKTLPYNLPSTELVLTNSDAIFGLYDKNIQQKADQDKCSNDVSIAACMKKCTLTNIETACTCVPFGLHRFIRSDGSVKSKFCQLEDEPCLTRTKANNGTGVDCRSQCPNLCSIPKYKWSESQSKPSQIGIDQNINSLITGQPTHWTWTLTCDSFDYIEFVDKELITWTQYLGSVGGILGFYATIFGLLLLLLWLIGKLIDCCCGDKKKDEHENYQIHQSTTKEVERNYYQPITLNGDVRRAIEEAVAAEMKNKSYTSYDGHHDSTIKGGAERNIYVAPKNTPYYDVPKNTYVSHISLEHD